MRASWDCQLELQKVYLTKLEIPFKSPWNAYLTPLINPKEPWNTGHSPLQTTYSSPKSCKETKGDSKASDLEPHLKNVHKKIRTYVHISSCFYLLPLASSYFQFPPLINCWIFISCSGYISNSQKPGRASMSWVKPSKRCSDKTCR